MLMPSCPSLWIALLGSALLAAACARPQPGPPSASRATGDQGGDAAARFAAFAEGFTRDALALSPPFATLAGLHAYRDAERGVEIDLDRELDDLSPEATARKIRFFRSALLTMERDFPADALPEQERIDREILESQCRLALFDLERIRSIETNPTQAVESIGTALFFPVVLEYAPREERARDLMARLEKVPSFVDQAIAALSNGPLVHVQDALDENEGNRDVMEQALPALFAQGAVPDVGFEAARRAAREAIDRFRAFLQTAAKERPAGEWRLGPDLYREKFRAYFGEGLEPQDLLREAEESLGRIREGMRAVAEPLHDRWFPAHKGHRGMKDAKARTSTIVREVLGHIGEDHVPRDRFFGAIRGDLDRIAAFLETHPIVSRTRHDNLKIIETPPFLRGVYGVAGLHAAPPLQPDLHSFYYVPPIPPDWPADQAESKLREYNRYKLLLLSIHEALPGHYTQLEYANRVRPEWRRIVRSVYGSGAYVEGWAQYAEEMMLEQGIADRGDPAMDLTFKKEELRIVANAVL